MVMIKPRVDLYYSQSLLGHFTLIVYDRMELIAFRIHFVDKDAEASHSSTIGWVGHKVAQVTGFAKGLVLSDWVASPMEFQTRVDYATTTRVLVRGWAIAVEEMDAMLNWATALVRDQGNGSFMNYGYIIYCGNVDNCGSFALQCLSQAGINITLPTAKSWFQLPTLIKGDI